MSTPTDNIIQKHHEIPLSQQVRDTRTIWQHIYAILQMPRVASATYFLLGGVVVLNPQLWIPVLFAWFLVWFTLLGIRVTLPFNLPFVAKQMDYNDPKPGRKGFNESAGIYYAGNEMDTGEELYLNFDTLLRHMLIFGTTGAGKTETLASVGANFISTGAGLIYNDAKAAPKLAWQIYTIARYFGRDDDFLLINYLTGNNSEKPDPADRLTNDSAPFAFGSAEASSQLVISMMPQDKGGANKVFSEAAIALISAVMPALTELRDKGLLLIDPKVIRSYMEYDHCTKLMANPNISTEARQAIVAFIRSRSGYDAKKPPHKQPEEVKKQFGFAQSYFIRALSSLSDTYGHIYMVGAGEVDFRDVILNDRILCTLLPSMQYSGEELQNLGKIILSAIRNAMATGLGYKVEGSKEEVLESLPTNTTRPSGIINDEYAYMAVEGFAITAAQGRGLNFSMIFAGQDYAGFKSASEQEAEQIVANCRFKYIMALEDAGSTLDLVKKIAGDTYISLSQGMEGRDDNLLGGYKDTYKTNVQKVDRISVGQLKQLNMGEGFAFYMDKMILMRNFWHGFTDADLISNYRVGRRVLLDFRPTRGPMKEALAQDAHAIRSEIKIWIDHLDDEEVNGENLQPPTLFEDKLPLLEDNDVLATLTPAERGIYFVGKLLEEDGSEDEEDLEQGSILSSVSGTFGGGVIDEQQGAGENDTEMQEAVDQVAAFFDSLDIDEDEPEAKPLTSDDSADSILTNEEAEELELDSEYANTDVYERVLQDAFGIMPGGKSSAITDKEQVTIAKGIAKIEKAGGATAEEAKQSAKIVTESVNEASQYPSKPLPDKNDVDKRGLTNMIQSFIKGVED